MSAARAGTEISFVAKPALTNYNAMARIMGNPIDKVMALTIQVGNRGGTKDDC